MGSNKDKHPDATAAGLHSDAPVNLAGGASLMEVPGDQELHKEEYKRRVTALREKLLRAQLELRKANFRVIVVFGGVDGAGKSEAANLLNEWMDPRGILTRAFDEPSPEEAERPEFWRFWLNLPRRGRIGLYLSSWCHRPLLDHVYGLTSPEQFEVQLERIRAFERTLTDDGAVLIKFWMHLGREDQEKKFRQLEADPHHFWRVTPRDWKHLRMYDEFVSTSDQLIQRTGTPAAPWVVVDGVDPNHRNVVIGENLLQVIRAQLDALGGPASSKKPSKGKALPEPQREAEPPAAGEDAKSGAARSGSSLLAGLDMSQRLEKAKYRDELLLYQARLNLLYRHAKERNISTVLVFEGWDAGGKGGAIRRITTALDARDYQVIPIAAPNDEERGHHYLWRFWRHLSRAGQLTVFDRSWYGRVLVERVEGFASKPEWKRAYREIGEFEEQLVRHGMVVAKFWLHITPEEQARRFEERLQVPHKRWKLTEEDWRNRERWTDYEVAVDEMVERTHSDGAPWFLIEANDKRYARVQVLRSLCDRLQAALG